MKYLKTFENTIKEYYIGDYILLKDDQWRVELECIILEKMNKHDLKYEFKKDENDIHLYRVKTTKIKNKEDVLMWVDYNEIERKMTNGYMTSATITDIVRYENERSRFKNF